MKGSQILVVDDEADIRSNIQEILAEEGYEVMVAADVREARLAVRHHPPQLVLLDIWMPDTDGISLLREWQEEGRLRCPVVMLSGHGTVETAIEATRLGAADFIEKPLSINKLLRTVTRALEARRPTRRGARGVILPVLAALGRSKRVRELREQAEALATGSRPVLISGEPGTGRGAFASFIHESGPHRERPFVKIAGASLVAENSAQLLLGADTPRGPEPGAVERAGGGTLFVSNIEDASPQAQALLLGIVETGSYARLGQAAMQSAGMRLIASVRSGTLAEAHTSAVRKELIDRIAASHIVVPSVREYAEDVSELLRYTAEELTERQQLQFRRFGIAAQNRLRHYPWPGNLRELTALVERLAEAGGAEEISLAEVEKHLMPVAGSKQALVQQDLLALPLREAREQFERAYLTEQLALCSGKVGMLAKRVGMERTHLYRKLRSLGVEFRGGLGEE
ncbi:MAG: sigma-54-dependent Fis family transcriptional regulator [Gammaproteobacteria bacterium]|nr:sigma-54-dependent Fis family transcriptional regulator [Gammaproteobacteria bacterium]